MSLDGETKQEVEVGKKTEKPKGPPTFKVTSNNVEVNPPGDGPVLDTEELGWERKTEK